MRTYLFECADECGEQWSEDRELKDAAAQPLACPCGKPGAKVYRFSVNRAGQKTNESDLKPRQKFTEDPVRDTIQYLADERAAHSGIRTSKRSIDKQVREIGKDQEASLLDAKRAKRSNSHSQIRFAGSAHKTVRAHLRQTVNKDDWKADKKSMLANAGLVPKD